jgi:hypothetical protein
MLSGEREEKDMNSPDACQSKQMKRAADRLRRALETPAGNAGLRIVQLTAAMRAALKDLGDA